MKPRFLLDTSCMVAAVCSWHTRHETTATQISSFLSAGQELITAAPALVEAYTVLTRLPAPHRLAPADALALLNANFMARRRVISLDSRAYVRLLRSAPSLGIYGGQTYDAVIFQCAAKAQAATLLTLNETDFRKWESARLRVVVPNGTTWPSG